MSFAAAARELGCADPPPTHKTAEAFPLMPDDRLRFLAGDIKEYGLMRPVVLIDGAILDGRNRFLACLIAKVEPRFRVYDGETDPRSLALYVARENLMRRDLDDVERVLCLRRLGKTIRERKERSKFQAEFDCMDPNHASEAVLSGCAPEVQDAVIAGELRGSDLATFAQCSHEEQLKELENIRRPEPEKPPAVAPRSLSIELSEFDVGALNALIALGESNGGQFRAGAKLLRKMVPGV